MLLPAGTIDPPRRPTEGRYYVALTKDQIEGCPKFDQRSYNEPAYRNRVGDYLRSPTTPVVIEFCTMNQRAWPVDTLAGPFGF